jgi:hypothetical protein
MTTKVKKEKLDHDDVMEYLKKYLTVEIAVHYHTKSAVVTGCATAYLTNPETQTAVPVTESKEERRL